MNKMNEIYGLQEERNLTFPDMLCSSPGCSNCGSQRVVEISCQKYPNDYSTEKICLDCGATEA